MDPAKTEAHQALHLRWGFLLRTIQVRHYLHSCTLRYCLLNRRSCRFFFPWAEQPEQQFDEENQRTAYRRRYPMDDQWVVPHTLETAAFSPATINIVLFDPEKGADTARGYVTKYVAKPEPWGFMETEDRVEPKTRVRGALGWRAVAA